MVIKEGYKQTEVGIIPEDWDLDIVKNLAIIKTGGKNTQDKIENGLYPFFVRSQTIESINSYSFDGEAVLTAGDGVGVGKVIHYINGKFDCHQRVYRINNFVPYLNGYFFYLYFSNNFYNRIMQMTAKSSVDSIRMDMIAKMYIPLPSSLTEQTAIATALSDADALITSLEKLNAKKRLIKQGAMQQLLQPKDGWEVKTLGEIAEIATGTTPPTRDLENYGNEYCFASPADLGMSKYINETDKNLSKKGFSISRKFPKNSILFTCIGSTIGKSGITSFEMTSNQQINAIFPNDNFYSDYIYYYLALISEKIKLSASEQAVPMINKTEFEKISVLFPPKEEQTRIATILSDMDAELSALEQKLSKYKKVKLGMMQELLTGKTRLV